MCLPHQTRNSQKKRTMSPQDHISPVRLRNVPKCDCLLHLTGASLQLGVVSPPSLLKNPWNVRHCLFSLIGSTLNKEVMLPYSRIISPRAETMSPPSDQSLPHMGVGGCFLFFCLSLAPVTGLLTIQESLGGAVPTPCTYLHTWTPPILARTSRTRGSTWGHLVYPQSLAKTSCQVPRWGWGRRYTYLWGCHFCFG